MRSARSNGSPALRIFAFTASVLYFAFLREAFYAADGDVTSSEGEIQVRFEAISGEEVR